MILACEKDKKIEEFYNFSFILYRYISTRDIVEVIIDGKKAKFLMKRDDFENFIRESCNDEIAGKLRLATCHWDVYFLYDRQNNKNKMLHLKAEKFNTRFTKEDFAKCEKSKKVPLNGFEKLNQDFNSIVNSIIYK